MLDLGSRYNASMDPSALLAGIWHVFLDASIEILPLFLLAVILGAVLEEFLSNRTIERFLTGRHPATMLVASTTGALIPLCTCGMAGLLRSHGARSAMHAAKCARGRRD